MKLINPGEISGKIMTLIDDAEKELIIVSPYNRIRDWDKLKNRIHNAKAKAISISWYSRKNNVTDENAEEVRALGIEPILVDNLHAKIYLNEERAIFTSMNLSKVSDDNSIDLGYITENKKEYDDLYNVFKKHIQNSIFINKRDNSISKKVMPLIPKNEKSQAIYTKAYHINRIHDHICSKYSFGSYVYKDLLEYYDFIRPGYKIQFESYDKAIKIYIYPPEEISIEIIKNSVNQDQKKNRLCFAKKLSFSDFKHNIYYYYISNFRVIDWEKNSADVFLNDLDIIVELVFKKV